MVEADSSEARVPTAGSLVRMSWPEPLARLVQDPRGHASPSSSACALWDCASPARGPAFPHTLVAQACLRDPPQPLSPL